VDLAEVTMAIIVDVPLDKLRRVDELADEVRCKYEFNGKRCGARRMNDEVRCCDLHERWNETALARMGSPVPVDVLSTQIFLAFALNEVMNERGDRTDAEIQGILSLAKLMAKNAMFL
jgi:hypothetical protein